MYILKIYKFKITTDIVNFSQRLLTNDINLLLKHHLSSELCRSLISHNFKCQNSQLALNILCKYVCTDQTVFSIQFTGMSKFNAGCWNALMTYEQIRTKYLIENRKDWNETIDYYSGISFLFFNLSNRA